MRYSSTKFFAAGAAALICLSVTTGAWAEASTSERSLTGFFRRLFNYPGKAVKETASMTANTLSNTGEKVVSATGENTAAVLGGDVAKTGEWVVDPVKGALETAGQAAVETVQIPVKAAQEESQPATQE